ncbi:hypothetical protein C0993_010995, partial [Termitomyces sp. T159_Od127]
MPPDRGLTMTQRSGVKGNKKQLNSAFTMNATGTEKLPPVIIGKAERPRAFQKKSGAQLGFYWRSNAKAQMTTILYQECQLMLASFIASRLIIMLTLSIVPLIVDTAWKKVDTTTIQNCWKKTGIFHSIFHGPATPSPSVPVSSILNIKSTNTINMADIEVEKALSHLEEHGVLQHKNWIGIDELLNPANKNEMYADGMAEDKIEKDIFSSVIERCKVEKRREEKSGDISNDEVIDKKPSCQEALNAASTVLKYVFDLNQPFAHEVECILANFGCHTCLEESQSLRPTTLNEYFSRKLE